nr:hypothetical protein [Tanacetum cinerariifolium]
MLHVLRVEMVINSPWMLSKNWLVQKQTDFGQTATGKESSNPFMAAVVKRSGDVTRLQALVVKKRIMISEEVVREILQLNDAEGVICLPNAEIFAGLARQRFNFSKCIFESLVRNVDSTSKFYMYPRVGKGFLGVETPLFENMLAVRSVDAEEELQVPAQDDVVQEHVIEEIATEVVPPTPTSPSPSSPIILSTPPHQSPTLPQPQAAEGSSHLVQQVLDKCSALILRVKGLETANAAQQLEIIKLKAMVKKLERLNKVKSSKLERLKKVGTSQRVESSEDEENVFNQGRISVDMDQDERVDLVVDQEKNAAQGFEQIIDFLSGSYIHHALTVNPEVYISCIKQFWNTAVVKRSGDVTRLQALVDKKSIVISEEVVREILQLNDAEGVICLSNDEIFAGLARMGYEKPSTKLTFYKAFFSTQWKFFIHTILHSLISKRTSWNEFSSAMASALIYLSSGQRVGKGFSGVETTLFKNMLAVRAVDAEEEVQVPAQDDVVQEHVIEEIATKTANATQQLEIIKLKARVKKLERLNKVKSSKLRRLNKVGTSQRVESSEDKVGTSQRVKSSEDEENVFNHGRISVDMDQDERVELVVDQEKSAEVEGRQADMQAEIYNIDLDHSSKVAAASTPIPAAKSVAKPKVLKIVAASAVLTRRRKGVVIRDPEEELHTDTPAETPTVKDKGKGILIEDPKPMKKKDQIEMDAEYAKKLQEELEKEHEEAYKQID